MIEAVIALVILMIAVVGVFGAFTYAIRYNNGNSSRSQALSVLQREVELMRSAKFTPTVTDASLAGGVQADRSVTASNGTAFVFVVQTTVDDDPFTSGTQVNTATKMKEITMIVTPQSSDGSWVTGNQVRAIFRRVRAN